MDFKVSMILDGKEYEINGFSYLGEPRSNTCLFVTKKVAHLLTALKNVENCLIYAEEGINVCEELKLKHAFLYSLTPQLDYARFANRFADARFNEEKKLRFKLSDFGYYVSEDVRIPVDAYIEPGCIIGPDVQIGKNARILAGSVIRRASIGDDFYANEYSVVGTNGFTMTEDEEKRRIRIPTLGRVIIGNSVEVGAHDNISCGSGGNTVLEDNVKIDALVYIGHDAHLFNNVEIAAGVSIGGFVNVLESAYIGIHSVIRNRVSIGEHSYIGMGATVTKSVPNRITVVGNPAKPVNK